MSLQDILIATILLQTTAQAACIPSEDCPSGEQSFTLVREGSLRLRDVINSSYPESTVEVNGNFSDYVCPLFEEYSRFSITHDNYLKENDSLSNNLSVLVLVAEKLLIDSCQYAAQNTDNLTINCSSIYSISKYCLDTPNKNQTEERIQSYFEVFEHSSCLPGASSALWLTELVSYNLPEWRESTQDFIITVLSETAMNCTLSINNSTVCTTCCPVRNNQEIRRLCCEKCKILLSPF